MRKILKDNTQIKLNEIDHVCCLLYSSEKSFKRWVHRGGCEHIYIYMYIYTHTVLTRNPNLRSNYANCWSTGVKYGKRALRDALINSLHVCFYCLVYVFLLNLALYIHPTPWIVYPASFSGNSEWYFGRCLRLFRGGFGRVSSMKHKHNYQHSRNTNTSESY